MFLIHEHIKCFIFTYIVLCFFFRNFSNADKLSFSLFPLTFTWSSLFSLEYTDVADLIAVQLM